MAIVTVLLREEWEVHAASSAEEALIKFETQPFDLLVVDKNLPGKSGVEFVREMRNQRSDAACIMVTGYATSASAMEMVQLGVDAYIEKPFDDIFDIVSKVKSSLEKLELRRSSKKKPGENLLQDEETIDTLKEAGSLFKKSHEMITENRPADRRVCTILVVSTEADDRNWLASLMEGWGSVGSLTSAGELLKLLESESPDMLVLNLKTEDPDIFTLLTQIKKQSPRTVCMIVVEKPSFEVLTRLIDYEIDGIIDKPFDKEIINVQLSRLIRITIAPDSAF